MALKVFNKYDKDGSGFLDKREALTMLDEILISHGKQKSTMSQFNRFFAEIDDNGDGVLSRNECTRFVRRFLGVGAPVTDPIETLVYKIFAKYDKDRNGYLDKPEVLKMLDEILINQGRPKTTMAQFNRFFAEFDDNGDNVISKNECYNFVSSFLGM